MESESELNCIPTPSPLGVIGGLDNIAVVETGPIGPMIFHLVTVAHYNPAVLRELAKIKLKVTKKFPLPWQTLITLLCPEADGPKFRGFYQFRRKSNQQVETIHYMIRKLWEQPPPEPEEDPISEIILAPLTQISVDDLPPLLKGIHRRLLQETDPEHAVRAWSQTIGFAQMRFPAPMVRNWVHNLSLTRLLAQSPPKSARRTQPPPADS